MYTEGTTWTDIFKYITLDNPISQALIISTRAVIQGAQKQPIQNVVCPVPPPAPVTDLWRMSGGYYNLIRIAGISGAAAVGLGIYGRYILTMSEENSKVDRKEMLNSTNRSHFLNTMVLLTTPLMRRPLLVGGLMTLGIVLFNGDGYYRALSGKMEITPLATAGSICLMTAWICVALF